MLAAIGGASALEILVELRDLSQAGLLNLQRNVATTEARVNATNFGGFSKASKGLAADAEAAAGKSGGGGLMSMVGGLVGLPGPLAVAGLAIGAFAGLSAATIPVYEKVKQQEDQLAVAFKDHGENLDKLRPKIDDAIKTGEGYAFNADQTRGAILKLTEAGMSFSDIQTNLPHIMDLARAKNLDLTDAARMYELALMGNGRALKDLGIALPKLIDPIKAHELATNAVTAAQAHLDSTSQHLTDVENGLAGKHTLTKAEAIKLRDAHAAVDDASKKLKDAQDKLAATQDTAAAKADRARLVNDGLTKALGNQRDTATPLQKAQAQLGDAWEHFSTAIAPALTAALTGIITVISTLVGWIADAVSWFGSLFAVSDKQKAQSAAQQRALGGGRGSAVVGQGGTGNINNTGGRSHRALGGTVMPGGSYIVGEEGPENLDIGPGGMGMVSPIGGRGGGAGMTVHHTSIVQLDGREIARQVDRYLHRSLIDAGTGIRRPLGG